VLIVVGTSHRPEAFQLCRDILEVLKREVPIYGKEIAESGSHAWKVNR
jgi:molybdopterin synthase catalytic subunit